MRKLKGITINGEWLGDNVVINGIFRTICAISPSVMQEFIKAINSIEKLDEAVRINKFCFPDNNTIEIEFSNKSINGLADLYFYLENGSPKLKDSRLVLKNEEKKEEDISKTIQIKEEEYDSITSDTISEEPILKEVIAEEIPEENFEEYIPVPEESFNSEESVIQDTEENITAEIVSEPETVESEADTEPVETENNSISKDAITSMVDEIIAKAPNLAGLAQPVQIQVVQPEIPQAPQIQPVIIQTPIETNVKKENADIAQIEANNENEPVLTDKNTDNLQDRSEENMELLLQKEAEDESIIEFPEEKTPETVSQEEITEEIQADIPDTDKVSNIEENEIFDNFEENTEDYNVTEENDLSEENDDRTTDNEAEDIEAISEYLAEFYNTDKPSPAVLLDEKTRDNIAMQAMLSEMVTLKDELDKLKSEQPKPTLTEFFGDNEPEYDDIEDDEADFKILGDGTRINASILDEDLFIAGRKLYRWGDTLYLDE